MGDFKMMCPLSRTLCRCDCAWLLESDYGHGSGNRIESNGFYVCAIAKLAADKLEFGEDRYTRGYTYPANKA